MSAIDFGRYKELTFGNNLSSSYCRLLKTLHDRNWLICRSTETKQRLLILQHQVTALVETPMRLKKPYFFSLYWPKSPFNWLCMRKLCVCKLWSAYHFVSHYQAIPRNMSEIMRLMHSWAEVVLGEMKSFMWV